MKNKKLMLSVLSTALVGSMTSAAFAHPQAGIYIGGEIAKFYSLDAFISDVNFDAALDEMIEDPSAALFVDENGYVANIYDLLTAESAEDALHYGSEEDFDALGALDGFTSIDENGEEGDIYDPIVDIELPGVDSIEVDASGDNELTVGDANDSSLVLTAVAYDVDGHEVDAEFTFETSNAAVATVDANGKVEAKGEGTATITVKSGEVSATYEVKVNPAAALEVTGVTALNAKQLEVSFNKAVDKATVIDNLNNLQNVTVTAIGASTTPVGISPLAATLSEDGKKLTIIAADKFSGQYAVTVGTGVETATDEAVKAFSTIVNVADTVRPTMKVEQVDFQTFKVVFSEPIKNAGSVTAAEGVQVDTSTLAQGYATLNLINAAENTDLAFSFVGATDFADNIISPNPATGTVKKVKTDIVPPQVANIQVVSDRQFKVTVSEKLKLNNAGNPIINVSIDNVPVTVAPTVDATGLVLTYTLTTPITGIHTVSVSGATDLSGNENTAVTTKTDNFVADTVAPTVTGTKVEKLNGEEYLVVTFSEDVVLDAATVVTFAGQRVSNYVEKNLPTTPAITAVPTYLNDTVKNAIKVPLSHAELKVAGAYNVSLTINAVTDVSGVAFAGTASAQYNRGADEVVLKTPELTTAGDNGIVKVNNNTYEVHFNSKLDPATALNKDNYVFEGIPVQSAIFTQNDENGAIVKLTLEAGKVDVSGVRMVEIKNVKSAEGVAMKTFNGRELFTENVAPTLVSAAFKGNDTITITFSEDLTASTVTDLASDFAVFVDNQDITSVGYNVYTATTVEEQAGTTGKVFNLVLGRAIHASEWVKTIDIRLAANADAADAAENKVVIPTPVIVTK